METSRPISRRPRHLNPSLTASIGTAGTTTINVKLCGEGERGGQLAARTESLGPYPTEAHLHPTANPGRSMIDPNAKSPRKIIPSVIARFTSRKPGPKPRQQATRSRHSIAESIQTVGKVPSLRVDSTPGRNASTRLSARRNRASGKKPGAFIAKLRGNQDLSFPCNQIRADQLTGPSPQRAEVDPMTAAEKRVPRQESAWTGF